MAKYMPRLHEGYLPSCGERGIALAGGMVVPSHTGNKVVPGTFCDGTVPGDKVLKTYAFDCETEIWMVWRLDEDKSFGERFIYVLTDAWGHSKNIPRGRRGE